jgi:predicted nucleic-acid-binding protein
VTTIADCLHVLTSRRLYHIPRTEVAEILAALIGRPGLHVPDREVVLRALDLYGTINIDFGDAMIVAATESTRQQVVYSYDRDFDRFSGIDRREP